ncbi:MAG: FkbM family methyltransferase [Sedimentisphaerales bacterium]
MAIGQRIFVFSVQFLRKVASVLDKQMAESVSAELAEEMIPIITKTTKLGAIKFFCPGKVPVGRARSLLSKEPETIEWINTFTDNDIFWDIGANVGLYSLYAGLNPSLTILSFEPSPANYYLLCRNLEINKMDNRISAYCLAFNDVSGLNTFYMQNTELGGALNSFAESVDCEGNPFTASLKQAMIGFSIDDFVKQFNPPFPNHIKIDVDGIENKIINGAKKTLSDERLKSFLIELDSNRKQYTDGVIQIIKNAGLKFHVKKHCPRFDTGPYASIYNYIFVRA